MTRGWALRALALVLCSRDTSDDTTTFGYDDNGNMTSMTLPDETVWNYGYDYENRLTSVTDNDAYTGAYTYSADGMRLRAQESNHAYTDRWFLYDEVRPTAEGTLSGNTFTATERYVWEGDSYYSPLVYQVYSNARYYPLFDGLGSTRQLLNENQTVTDTYSYEAFGNLLGSTGSTPNPYRYVGSLGYYQTGSSLQHLGARYYMPEVGRFTTSDPLTDGARTRGAYTYADNLPTLARDPAGLKKKCDCEAQRDHLLEIAKSNRDQCLDDANTFARMCEAGVAAACAARCAKRIKDPLRYAACVGGCVAGWTVICQGFALGMRRGCREAYNNVVDAIYKWYEKCKAGQANP